MTKATNYQCPACGGPLHFGGASNKLECDYCGSSFDIEQIDKLYAQKNEKAEQSAEKSAQGSSEENAFDDGIKFSQTETDGLKAYNCPSCGAQLFCDDVTASTSCPYCGNNQVLVTQFKGGKKPDVIIPFKISKDEAVKSLQNHYKGKRLLPSVFSAQNHIEEVKGVYVPFWLFDGQVDLDVDFETTTSTVRYTSREKIITTAHYNVNRKGTVDFEKISVDASKKMDDALMDSLEPFDLDSITPFTASYLPGYFAEVYDVSTQECFERAKKRAETTAIDQISASVKGYESVRVTSKKVNMINKKVTYAFLPVWILSTKWRDKNFLFAVNGQTGKMVGNLPVDKGKFWKYFFIITAAVAAVVTPIVYFLF